MRSEASNKPLKEMKKAFALLFFLALFPMQSHAAKVHPDVWAAIKAMAGDPETTQNGKALAAISLAENSGRNTPARGHLNSNGTRDWGILQINDVNLLPRSKVCGAMANDLMTGNHIPRSVQCSLKIFLSGSKKCVSFAAKLCSYNRGAGWCVGYTKNKGTPRARKVPPHPNEGCDYSVRACTMAGIKDCNSASASIGTNPYAFDSSGDPEKNLLPAEAGEDVGGPGGTINCVNNEFSQALAQASVVWARKAQAVANQVYDPQTGSGPVAGSGNFDLSRPAIRGSPCISMRIAGFDKILDFISFGSIARAILNKLVNDLATAACASASSYINSALSELCVSVPKLSFSLDASIPGGTPKTCDGISLTDIVKTRSGRPILLPGAWSPYSLGTMTLINRLK